MLNGGIGPVVCRFQLAIGFGFLVWLMGQAGQVGKNYTVVLENLILRCTRAEYTVFEGEPLDFTRPT